MVDVTLTVFSQHVELLDMYVKVSSVSLEVCGLQNTVIASCWDGNAHSDEQCWSDVSPLCQTHFTA